MARQEQTEWQQWDGGGRGYFSLPATRKRDPIKSERKKFKGSKRKCSSSPKLGCWTHRCKRPLKASLWRGDGGSDAGRSNKGGNSSKTWGKANQFWEGDRPWLGTEQPQPSLTRGWRRERCPRHELPAAASLGQLLLRAAPRCCWQVELIYKAEINEPALQFHLIFSPISIFHLSA